MSLGWRKEADGFSHISFLAPDSVSSLYCSSHLHLFFAGLTERRNGQHWMLFPTLTWSNLFYLFLFILYKYICISMFIFVHSLIVIPWRLSLASGYRIINGVDFILFFFGCLTYCQMMYHKYESRGGSRSTEFKKENKR